MPVRVELIDAAVEDLARYAETGNLPLFLKKVVRLEEVGQAAGLPLGRGLTGWRKIVVGDRDWRIIFTVDPAGDSRHRLGDRRPGRCRLDALGKGQPPAASLAAVIFQLSELHRAARRTKRRRS